MNTPEILDEYARYKYVVENIKDVIWELDTNLAFTFVSPSTKGMTGFDAAEMVGRSLLEFLTEASGRFILSRAEERRVSGDKSESPLYDVEFVCKDGSAIWAEVCVKPVIQDGAILCYIGTTRDISERKMYEQKLREALEGQKQINTQLENMATFDMLTGAYNRRKFECFVSRETEKSERYGNAFSICIFDIDSFKQINDLNGHSKGDRVLQDIAAVVQRTLRTTDPLFRWGGDEFIVLLPDLNLKGALVVANKIREAVEAQEFDIEGRRVTVSLGVGAYAPGETMDQYVTRVDKALLRAKNNGKNCVEIC